MPITKRPPPVKKATRASGKATNIRFVSSDAKGATADFDELLEVAHKADLKEQQLSDPFTWQYGTATPLPSLPLHPSFSFEQLAKIVQGSNTLRQCIESYVVNIESYGYTLEYIGEEGKEELPRVQAEKAVLEGFLANCSPDNSLRTIRERSRWDLETMGTRFYEIARDRAGRVVLFDHIPGLTMRRTRRTNEQVEVKIEIPNPADPTQTIRKTAVRSFCKFVQISYAAGGWQNVYFKEFGDPRVMDPKTGDYVTDGSLPVDQQATEVYMDSLYTPGQIYGLPRWFGQLPSILGSREAEVVNLNFFKENAIPAMAVLISGGALTKDSFDAVSQYLTAIRGKKAMNRLLILEAQADDTIGSIEKGGAATTKIDLKPMGSERQQDQLFGDYDAANQQKVRGSFRLPPIYAGRAEDYTRASAFASMITAEQQIFNPERTGFDEFMQKKILSTYRPKYWRFKTAGIPIVDPDTMGNMLLAMDETGALTPNAVIKIANRVLGIDIKPVAEDWGDFPFQAVLQYINQGKDVPGLTEYIVDLEAEAEKAAQDQQNAIDLANAQPKPTATGAKPGGKPTSNDRKIKPVNNNDAKGKQSTRKQEHQLRQIIRRELDYIAGDLKNAVVAAVQVTARD